MVIPPIYTQQFRTRRRIGASVATLADWTRISYIMSVYSLRGGPNCVYDTATIRLVDSSLRDNLDRVCTQHCDSHETDIERVNCIELRCE